MNQRLRVHLTGCRKAAFSGVFGELLNEASVCQLLVYLAQIRMKGISPFQGRKQRHRRQVLRGWRRFLFAEADTSCGCVPLACSGCIGP